ncbi:MAG: STAS domain-containing protein [Colwellia sp.]
MIKLPNELTIAHVDQYKATILAEIDQQETIELDDSDLERLDTIGVQFILAVVTYIHAQGKQLSWNSTSKALKDSLIQLGINDDLVMQYLK